VVYQILVGTGLVAACLGAFENEGLQNFSYCSVDFNQRLVFSTGALPVRVCSYLVLGAFEAEELLTVGALFRLIDYAAADLTDKMLQEGLGHSRQSVIIRGELTRVHYYY